jgi:6-phosphogluconolactonase (cycloisomerase 2 family)
VTVQKQPSVPRETCSVVNGSGTLGSGNVANVAVDCSRGIGFLYSLDLGNEQVDAYGISADTGVVTPIGSPVATGAVASGGGAIALAPAGQYLYVVNCSCDPGVDTSASISTYGIDSTSGRLTPLGSPVPAGNNSGRIAMASSGFLFILNGEPWTLSEYALDPGTGIPRSIGTPLSWPVNAPIVIENLAVTPDGRLLYVLSTPPSTLMQANTTPSTLTAYAIDPSTGVLTLGPSTTINGVVGALAIDPLGRYLYLTDGVIDTVTFQTSGAVLTYAIDSSNGALTQMGLGTTVASDGYALVPDPQGRYLYVFNEAPSPALGGSVQALTLTSAGAVDIVGSTSLTYSPTAYSVDPSGRFVFMAGADGFSSFAISTQSGTAGQLIPSALNQPVQIAQYVIVE